MHSDDVTVFRKLATTAQGVARLRQEAILLRQGAHPGITELLSCQFTANHAELELATVDGETLENIGELSPEVLALLMATTAATVAYLHEQGIVHGRLSGDHVIVSRSQRRTVLCGFGGASTAVAGGESLDVAALGQLLLDRLPGTSIEAIRRRLSEEPRGSFDNALVTTLRSLGLQATNADETKRPTARRLAEQLRAAANGARRRRLPAQGRFRKPAKPGRHAQGRVRAARRMPVIIGGVVVAAVLIAFTEWHALSARSTAAVASTAASAGPMCPVRTTPTSSAASSAALLTVDVDGDGCADAVNITPGMVTVNAEQYSVGQAGDIYVIGHWDCTNARTVAILRPTNGRVFVFDAWPASGAAATPRLVGTVPNATGISVNSTENTCDLIEVQVADKNKPPVELDPKTS